MFAKLGQHFIQTGRNMINTAQNPPPPKQGKQDTGSRVRTKSLLLYCLGQELNLDFQRKVGVIPLDYQDKIVQMFLSS